MTRRPGSHIPSKLAALRGPVGSAAQQRRRLLLGAPQPGGVQARGARQGAAADAAVRGGPHRLQVRPRSGRRPLPQPHGTAFLRPPSLAQAGRQARQRPPR